MCSWRTHETGNSQLLSLGNSSLILLMVWTGKQHHQRPTHQDRHVRDSRCRLCTQFVHPNVADLHCSLELFHVQWSYFLSVQRDSGVMAGLYVRDYSPAIFQSHTEAGEH